MTLNSNRFSTPSSRSLVKYCKSSYLKNNCLCLFHGCPVLQCGFPVRLLSGFSFSYKKFYIAQELPSIRWMDSAAEFDIEWTPVVEVVGGLTTQMLSSSSVQVEAAGVSLVFCGSFGVVVVVSVTWRAPWVRLFVRRLPRSRLIRYWQTG